MRRTHSRKRLAAALVAICTFSVTALAFAETASGKRSVSTDAEQSEARDRYARGMQLVGESNYQAALIEMQRAYSLNPSYKILYNLGQIFVHLNDYAAAYTNFERYLAEGGSDVPSPRVTEVNQELSKLRPRVASVDLDVKGEGAEVLLDDVVIGRSPFHKVVVVNAGKHRFSASRANSEPVARVIALAGEDKASLELDVSKKDNPAASTAKVLETKPTHVAPEPGKAPSTTSSEPEHAVSYVWVGWTLTAALGVGTGVAGYFATTKAGELRDLRDSPGATREALDSAESSTFRAALVTDILLGTTVLAGGLSLYFSLASGSGSNPERTASNLALVAAPGGMSLRGAF